MFIFSPEYRYVGNLDPSVTEELIMVLFGQIGTVKGCKIIHEVKSQSKPCPQLFDCTCGKWEAQALRATKHTSFRLFRLLTH